MMRERKMKTKMIILWSRSKNMKMMFLWSRRRKSWDRDIGDEEGNKQSGKVTFYNLYDNKKGRNGGKIEEKEQ